jgi:hypothetical protein
LAAGQADNILCSLYAPVDAWPATWMIRQPYVDQKLGLHVVGGQAADVLWISNLVGHIHAALAGQNMYVKTYKFGAVKHYHATLGTFRK